MKKSICEFKNKQTISYLVTSFIHAQSITDMALWSMKYLLLALILFFVSYFLLDQDVIFIGD